MTDEEMVRDLEVVANLLQHPALSLEERSALASFVNRNAELADVARRAVHELGQELAGGPPASKTRILLRLRAALKP